MAQEEIGRRENYEQEIRSLRMENAELKAKRWIDKAAFEDIAQNAMVVCSEQRQELAQIRAMQKEQKYESTETCKASNDELIEAFRELERLEHALVLERQRNATLLEEKTMSEERHTRDIAMLESMLQQIMVENNKLSEKVAAFEKDDNLDLGIQTKTRQQQVLPSVEVDEPEMEANPINKVDPYYLDCTAKLDVTRIA